MGCEGKGVVGGWGRGEAAARRRGGSRRTGSGRERGSERGAERERERDSARARGTQCGSLNSFACRFVVFRERGRARAARGAGTQSSIENTF